MLRKITYNEETIKMLIDPLKDPESPYQNESILGLSELLFEIISGHGEDVHSKGVPILR